MSKIGSVDVQYFVDLEVQKWQVQYFVDLEMHISWSWQVQYSVDLEVQIGARGYQPAQPGREPQSPPRKRER